MRRYLCAICLLMVLLPLPARMATWAPDSGADCRENRFNCGLLQAAMEGDFDACDPEDALAGRVLSSAYPLLCAVTEDDIDHFLEEFDEDRERVIDCLYTAMRNCLRARIRFEGTVGSASESIDRVLMLFIDPDSQENAAYQAEQIRANMTDEALERLAGGVNAPRAFIEWLIMG